MKLRSGIARSTAFRGLLQVNISIMSVIDAERIFTARVESVSKKLAEVLLPGVRFAIGRFAIERRRTMYEFKRTVIKNEEQKHNYEYAQASINSDDNLVLRLYNANNSEERMIIFSDKEKRALLALFKETERNRLPF